MRRAVALSSLLTLLCACGGAKTARVTEQPRTRGLERKQFVINRNADTPVIELRVLFAAGSADDPPGLEGLTYVTALTMLEGRAGELSFAEREQRLFPIAGQISAQVEREQVVFSGRIHRDHWAAFYPLFRDVLLAPGFVAADFERVRARALSHLTQDLRGADDETLGKELLQAMLFEGHPYAHPELGSERGLTALTRDQLSKQWARALCARRLHVAASGPLDEGFEQRIEADLGALASQACEARGALPPPSSLRTRRIWVVDKPEAQSVAMSLGMPLDVTRDHPDFAALSLAAAYLGQHRTFAGRLMQKMRGDRGLNYGDYAYAEHFVQEADTRFPAPNVARRQQYFSIWIRPVRAEHAHFALRMAVRELELFVTEGLSDADFERIRQFVIHYFALFAQTEQQRLGNALDDQFYELAAPSLSTLRAQFAKLTREQVNAAIKRHLAPSRLQVAIVAPGASELAKQLVRGDPSPISYNVDKPAEVLAEDKLIERHPLGLAVDQVNVLPLGSIFR
jgi:zinc protease